MIDIRVGEFGDRCLFEDYFAECYKEFVVDGSAVVEYSAGDCVYPFDSGFVTFPTSAWLFSELLFGAIVDFGVTMWRELALFGSRVPPFQEEVFDVMFDMEATCLSGVVPCEVDTSKPDAFPVLGNFAVLEEGVV